MIRISLLAATACGVMVAASAASAAKVKDLKAGTYNFESVISSTTGTNCPTVAGQTSFGNATYPGAGNTGMAVTENAIEGSIAIAATCVGGTVPSTGLNGAAVTFSCAYDTAGGAGMGNLASQSFNATPTNSPTTWIVTTSSEYSATCTDITSQAIWTLE